MTIVEATSTGRWPWSCPFFLAPMQQRLQEVHRYVYGEECDEGNNREDSTKVHLHTGDEEYTWRSRTSNKKPNPRPAPHLIGYVMVLAAHSGAARSRLSENAEKMEKRLSIAAGHLVFACANIDSTCMSVRLSTAISVRETPLLFRP